MPEENTTVLQEELPEKKSLSGRLLKYAVVLIAVLLGLAVLLFLFRDRIVESAIRRGGSALTGTEVKLQEFSSDLSGIIRLKGFSVSNPQGYPADNAVELNELLVHVDLPSIFRKKKIIRQISLRGLKVNLVSSFSDTNLSEIQRNIQKFTSSPEKETQKDAAATENDPEAGILIEKFDSDDGRVTYTQTTVNQPVTLLLPPLRLKNIGGSSFKETAVQIGSKMFSFINNAFGNAGNRISDTLRSAGKSLIKGTEKTGSEIRETGSNLLKSLKKTINFKKRK